MIICELDEQQCINDFGYKNITLDKLIKDNILYMYDLIDKCDECGLCWFNEEEIDWYIDIINLLRPICVDLEYSKN